MIMFPNTFTTICQRPICSLSLPLEMSNLQKHIIQISVLIFVLQHLISDQIRLSYYSILIIISSSIHTDVCSITSHIVSYAKSHKWKAKQATPRRTHLMLNWIYLSMAWKLPLRPLHGGNWSIPQNQCWWIVYVYLSPHYITWNSRINMRILYSLCFKLNNLNSNNNQILYYLYLI